MKKSIYFIILCAVQAGCSSYGGSLPETGSLLSFDDFEGEISVHYEVLDGTLEEATSVATTR